MSPAPLVLPNLVLAPCDGPLRTATDPPDSLDLYDPASPDPEGDCAPSNPLVHPGAEGQNQRLRAIQQLKPELEEEDRGKRSNSTTESLTGSRGDATDERGAAAQCRDSPGADETPRTTEEPKHNTGIQRPAPAAQEAPSEYSCHT
ncbi:hypothetical protein NDU88_007158 [Pleurodeles waltl]|uniref:Uncharacterized protein n=1 Tax=Pleurodeles waltl TaxID=8319 RepID=A0AAV7RS62_PLEWA|nr:hypothetical protein NDU88_007158 [Pleurodeles waltl]